MKRYIVFAIVSMLIACSSKTNVPDYVIPEDQMVEIFVEMHLMDGLLTSNRTRSSLIKNDSTNYYNLIFERYNFTRENFDTSVYFYSLNINKLDKIYEQVLNKLTELETQIKEESLEDPEIERQ